MLAHGDTGLAGANHQNLDVVRRHCNLRCLDRLLR
jgi:hypothetical protein